jgi:hypothetical protein
MALLTLTLDTSLFHPNRNLPPAFLLLFYAKKKEKEKPKIYFLLDNSYYYINIIVSSPFIKKPFLASVPFQLQPYFSEETSFVKRICNQTLERGISNFSLHFLIHSFSVLALLTPVFRVVPNVPSMILMTPCC